MCLEISMSNDVRTFDIILFSFYTTILLFEKSELFLFLVTSATTALQTVKKKIIKVGDMIIHSVLS